MSVEGDIVGDRYGWTTVNATEVRLVRTLRTIGLGIVLGLTVAACMGGTSSPTATEAPSAGAPAGSAGAVSIVDFAFTPPDVTVAVDSTVTWTNTGDNTHTVKWSDGTPESPGLANGATYERTFDTPGTYPYVCGIHGSMAGTVVVTE
ncbi:MAG: plastocyanin/azurin family copper-binding protein [Candidatus Limnocylindrales bacterium]